MPKLTIHDLFQAKQEGLQLVEIRTSDVNEAMAREYIPVVGHIGFVPYLTH